MLGSPANVCWRSKSEPGLGAVQKVWILTQTHDILRGVPGKYAAKLWVFRMIYTVVLINYDRGLTER